MEGLSDVIAEGTSALIRYTLHDDTGALLDESGAEPDTYLHGRTKVVPGLYRALAGRRAGEQFEVVVSSADGYGVSVGGVGPQPIPRGTFPEDTKLSVGMEFDAETPDGMPVSLFITDVTDHAVFVDKNHPFAGKELHYTVEVMAVEWEGHLS